MSVNSDEVPMMYRYSTAFCSTFSVNNIKGQNKKSRKAIPLYSKAFPKDFFYNANGKHTNSKLPFASPISLSRNRSPMRDIENIVSSQSASRDLTSEIKNYAAYLRKSLNETPQPVMHKRNSSSNILLSSKSSNNQHSSQKSKKLESARSAHRSQTMLSHEIGMSPNINSRRIEKGKSNDHFEDKENMIPQDNSLFTIEIEGQGTPIFKCAGSKREFYKDIQPKKIMLDVDPFTLSHDIIETFRTNTETNNVRDGASSEPINN